ncbi:MAG: hypothetical protein K1W34_05650 [Lachnospiraceae bacterium]
MDRNWLTLFQEQQGQNQLDHVLKLNQKTEKYGLVLTKDEAKLILRERGNALAKERRVEFGKGITEKLIYEFCDSDFICQDNYTDTIIRLQEIFYMYKNEMMDELSDDELLHLMREQFEKICFGDLDYLEGTCLNLFSQAVRAGYRGYKASDGRGEAGRFDETVRWDYGLYMEALRELF